jgi:fructokinase
MSTDAVVIWGELLWDRFPADLGGHQLGGAPANVAWHLAQAGGWAQLVTRVGDDAAGRRAIARLEALVDTSLVQVDPERATGEVTIELAGGEPRYTLHPGRAWERIACTGEVQRALRAAGVFVYGTLAQRTADGLAEWRRAVAAARTGALKVYDANLRPNDQASHAIADALEHADVIKLNDREIGQLGAVMSWDDPVAALRAERSAPEAGPSGSMTRGRPRIVVVTHGAAGSTIYPLEGAPIEIPAVPAAPGGDNVGCGDAYLALLVFGMISGWDLAASGRVASRWAAAVAGVRGATPLFDDDRIADLLELA